MTNEMIRQKIEGKKVGVVIPCHNYGRFLERCIESILNQTYQPDRIVVVDDSSTDNTKEICEKYKDTVAYVRVEYKHANKSRNHGIQLIPDCDFLLLFDADNYMNPLMIQRMLEYLINNKRASYVYSDRTMIDDNGVIGKRICFPEFDPNIFATSNFVDFASMMHRKVYDGMGGFTEEEEFFALEDWDFFYGAANKGFYGIRLPESMYYYRLHPTSKSIDLKNNPTKFQAIHRLILERNKPGYTRSSLPTVSFVFAARTEQEAQNLIAILGKQRYTNDVEYCYSTDGTIPEAMNKALAMVKNEAIVFVETDMVPYSHDWLIMLISSLEHGTVAFSEEISHQWFNWAGTGVYKRDLRGLQMDESYPVAEDTKFFEQLKLAGLKMKRSPAVVYHLNEHETQKALDRANQYGYLHAKLIDEFHYYPLEQYIKRLELQKQIAEQTLLGIKQYQDGKNTIR